MSSFSILSTSTHGLNPDIGTLILVILALFIVVFPLVQSLRSRQTAADLTRQLDWLNQLIRRPGYSERKDLKVSVFIYFFILFYLFYYSGIALVEDAINKIELTPWWKIWYIDRLRSSTRKAHSKVNSLRLRFDVRLSSLNKN